MDPNYYYTVNGFIVHDLSEVPENSILKKHPRLCGGKGGFGSMLRAIGSQIEKTTNREMCRDLNGRRMRDINNEKRLKEWIDKSDVREREKMEAYLEKRRKRKLLLQQGPSSNIPFEDKVRDDQRKQIAEELQEAINEAFEKRKNQEGKIKEVIKPKKYNLNVDSDLDSSSSSCPSSPSSGSVVKAVSASIEDKAVLSDCVESAAEEAEEQPQESSEEPPAKKRKSDSEDIVEEPSIPKEIVYLPIDLDQVGSANHLLTFGNEWIKKELASRGLKCGGTLMERAQRLFSVKGLTQYPENLLAGFIRKKRK